MISSTFNCYLWQRLIDDDKPMPVLNDTFFTQLFRAVTGGKSLFRTYFDDFAMKHRIGYYLPWMSNISQIDCC